MLYINYIKIKLERKYPQALQIPGPNVLVSELDALTAGEYRSEFHKWVPVMFKARCLDLSKGSMTKNIQTIFKRITGNRSKNRSIKRKKERYLEKENKSKRIRWSCYEHFLKVFLKDQQLWKQSSSSKCITQGFCPSPTESKLLTVIPRNPQKTYTH